MTETLGHASHAVLELKINREDLIQALTFHFEMTEAAWYLDTETGDILLDSDATDELPEDIEENPRYRWIESISSQASFRIMEDFVATVDDAAVAAHLSRVLGGAKPFRRFKDALLDSPELREAWFRFQDNAHTRLAEMWCEENGIVVAWL